MSVQTIERPISKEERDGLALFFKYEPLTTLVQQFIVLFILLAAVPMVVLERTGYGQDRYQLPLLACIAIWVGIFLRKCSAGTRSSGFQELVQRDLEEGVIVETTYHARRAVEIEETEDEGRQFYLELDSGEVLFLCGQYLYEDEEAAPDSPRFPCSAFTITTTKHSQLVWHISFAGRELPVEQLLPPVTTSMYDREQIPEDRSVLPEKFDDVVRRHFELTADLSSLPA